MKNLIAVLAVLAIVQFAHSALKTREELRDAVVIVDNNNTRLRAYDVEFFPPNHPRIVEFTGVEIDKTGQNTATLDACQFILTTFNQCTIFFGYFHEQAQIPTTNGGNLTEISAAFFAFAVRTFAVFEYIERNGIPGFQPNTTDGPTGLYDLSNLLLPWKDMVIEAVNFTDANGDNFTVHTITVQTLDEVFLMRFVIAGVAIEVNGVRLTPTLMKIDYQINWFTSKHVAADWTTGPSNATLFPDAQVGMLNVFAAVAEEVDVEQGQGDNSTNSTISFAAGAAFTGVFNWIVNADVTVSGVEYAGAVFATESDASSDQTGHIAEEWLARVIFFSFNGSRPESVAWDPVFGATINYNIVSLTSGNQPITSGNQPITSGNQPITSGNQPITSGNQPSTTSAPKKVSGSSLLVPSLLVAIFSMIMLF
jgi:hypothetical protein